jgi:hypothetical protein
MPIYRIMVEGNGCLVEIDGVLQRLGFYATRFIESEDDEAARTVAMDSVWAELQPWLQNPPDFPPTLTIESVDETARVVSSPGFTWYPDEENSN